MNPYVQFYELWYHGTRLKRVSKWVCAMYSYKERTQLPVVSRCIMKHISFERSFKDKSKNISFILQLGATHPNNGTSMIFLLASVARYLYQRCRSLKAAVLKYCWLHLSLNLIGRKASSSFDEN